MLLDLSRFFAIIAAEIAEVPLLAVRSYNRGAIDAVDEPFEGEGIHANAPDRGMLTVPMSRHCW